MAMKNVTSISEIILTADPASGLTKMNAQIYPSRTRVELNDKLAKVLFKLSAEGIAELLDGRTFRIIEKRNHKKHGNIVTAYKILNAEGYNVQRPFTLFDRFVLSVCISEWLAGNRYTTPAIIYRALTGKVGTKAMPSVKQRETIMESIEILMSRIVDYAAEDLCEVLGYNDGNPIVSKGFLLPAEYIEGGTLNGADTTVIFFTAEPPLLRMTEAKKQFIRYDVNLLDVTNQNNTPLFIAVKNYSMVRIMEIKAHGKQMAPTLTFADMLQKLRLEEAHREIKSRVREYMDTFFKHLQAEGIIKSSEARKKGNTFYGITFTY